MKNLKSVLKLLVVAGVSMAIIDRCLLLYIHKNFSNPDEYEKTEICTYPISEHSLDLASNTSGRGVFTGPMYNLACKLVGGAQGFKSTEKPIIPHQECVKEGFNFNLDSVTYIICIDTLTATANMFPSFDKKFGDMAYDHANNPECSKNKLIVQNGNYLLLKGGIHPLQSRQNHDELKTLKVAFGTDGNGNYVFVKYFGTIMELQEFLKKKFGRGNPNFDGSSNSPYAKAAFLYLDGNNIIFDGKYYIARRNSFLNDQVGLVKWLKLQYVKRSAHFVVRQK